MIIMKRSYWLFGSKQQILMNGGNTNNLYDLIEGAFPPGAQSPLHIHSRYSETIIVLEGEVGIFTPGEHHVLKAGDTDFIPANIPHAVVNESASLPFKAMCIASPSGFAELISSVGIEAGEEMIAPNTPHDMQKAMEVMAKIGDRILGPPGARP